MLNPRKEPKRERSVRREDFLHRRIPRDTGGSAAVSRPANAVRGIKYAVCSHNRIRKAGGACRRAFPVRQRRLPHPKIPLCGISAPVSPSDPHSA